MCACVFVCSTAWCRASPLEALQNSLVEVVAAAAAAVVVVVVVMAVVMAVDLLGRVSPAEGATLAVAAQLENGAPSPRMPVVEEASQRGDADSLYSSTVEPPLLHFFSSLGTVEDFISVRLSTLRLQDIP